MSNLLVDTLSKAGLITGKIEADQPLDSPWFVKVLLGFTGWLAAGFLLGFLGAVFAFTFLAKSSFFAFIIGFGLIVAYLLLRNDDNPFLDNLGLAGSLAGQALVLFGIFGLLRNQPDPFVFGFSFTVFQLLLVFMMPSYIHRVFSTFGATMSLFLTLYFYMGDTHFYSLATILSACLMFLVAFIWLNEFTLSNTIKRTQAIGYGLVLAQIALHVFKFLNATFFNRAFYLPDANELWFKPWMGEVLFAAITLYVVLKLLANVRPKASMLVTVIALVSVALSSLLSIEVSSLSMGIIILLLGFSANNRLLTGLGILSLLFFISHYYYALHNTLLDKSITLIIFGITLLVVRFILTKLFPTAQEVAS